MSDAIRVLQAARAAGITVELEGEFLSLQADGVPDGELLELLRRHKTEIVELLRLPLLDAGTPSGDAVENTAPKPLDTGCEANAKAPVDQIEELRRRKPEGMTALADTTVIAPVQWFEGAAAADEPPYDKPSPARRGLIRRPGGRFEHFCAACGAWGSFGYGVSVEQPGRWFCLRHRELGNNLSAAPDETSSL